MPIQIIKPANSNWGCSCPAFTTAEPTPEQALKALARAVVVTVTQEGPNQWEVWTEPESRYTVVREPGMGGFCKHVIACLIYENPWLREVALGADTLLQQAHDLEKENRKLGKEVTKWQKKCMG